MRYKKTIFHILTFLFISILVLPGFTISQPATITVTVSAAEVKANEKFEITFSSADQRDYYFYSIETTFDTDKIEFLDVLTTDLTAGGLSVADFVEPGVIGASVSRTEALTANASGDLMILRFRARSTGTVGPGTFSFKNQKVSDSVGEDIDADKPADAHYEFMDSIGDAELTTPASFTVNEGEEFDATGRVFATGVTDQSRIRAWMGVNDQNTDPSGWGEGAWILMDFVSELDDYFTYTGEIAFKREVGTYYVALRSDLDNDQEYVYGGTNGIWDASGSPNAVLEIEQLPPFRYTLAAWDFDDETLVTNDALPQNEGAEVELIGASLSGFVAGASGRAANSNGWNNFEEGTKYWQVSVSTKNFSDLRLSSKQDGSNTGPRDFQIQVSADGLSWEDLPGGAVTVRNDNFSTGVVDNLPLPSLIDNQETAYIRWLSVSDFRIDDSQGISSVGTNRLDDLIITGLNPEAVRVNVWPGDTNNDGVVDEEDVLPIGIYWLSVGPKPVYGSFAWEAREAESWVPSEATFADASGSGRVDQNDLQPVGLNFGESRVVSKQSAYDQPIASITIQPKESGEQTELYIITKNEKADLSGIAFRMSVEGISRELWSVHSVTPMEWGEEWNNLGRLLNFTTRMENMMAAAMVHRGAVEPNRSLNLAKIVLNADDRWESPATVHLLRSTVTQNREMVSLRNLDLSKEMAVSIDDDHRTERPEQTALLPNYPNPFNPLTTIPFTLSETSDVEIGIYDALGRRIATISREALSAGTHTISFDASAHSSGIYYYRLRANGEIFSRAMTVIK